MPPQTFSGSAASRLKSGAKTCILQTMSASIHEFPRQGDAKKAVILARVSTKEQEDGHSIEAQKNRLIGYCQRRGLEILQVFEITESSTVGDRQKFMAMVNFARRQKETIAIVADKIDRVQRSFREYPLLDDLIRDGLVELHFNTENSVIHKNSISQERMLWQFGIMMAQSYVDSLKDNVKRSQDHMIQNGYFPGLAPIGYLNQRDAAGKAGIIVDPARAPLIRRMFEEYAYGNLSVEELTQKLKSWGLRNKTKTGNYLTRSHVHKILNNPFYYGLMTIKGKTYPHGYEPLIEKRLFEQCQEILHGRARPAFHYGEKGFILRGLVSCATTGRAVTALQKKRTYLNGTQGEWTYLRCWNPHDKARILYIREEKVLAQIERAFDEMHIPEQTMQEIIAYLKGTKGAEQHYRESQITELRKEQTRIETRLDALMTLRMDGEITPEEYARKRHDLQQRLQEAQGSIEKHRQGDDGFNDALLFLLDLCRNAGELYKGSTIEQKRVLLGCIFENLSLSGETLCFSLRKPFSWIAEGVKKEKWSTLVDSLRTSDDARVLIIDFQRHCKIAA